MICEKCGVDLGGGPYCTSVVCLTKRIIRVEKNPAGGYLTYTEGFKHPLRALPKQNDLHYIDSLKRTLIGYARFWAKLPITPKRFLHGTLFWLSEIWEASITVRDFGIFREDEWSPTTNEFIRVLANINPISQTGWIYYLASIWETDQAYRSRGQDIFSIIDKRALRLYPYHEIMRLVDELIRRESTGFGGQLPKVKILKQGLRIVMWFPSWRNLIIGFFTEIDPEAMEFDINDRYWLANKFDYNYEGKTYEERMAWKRKEEEGWIPEEIPAEKPQLALNPPNEEFYKLTKADAEIMAENMKKLILQNWEQKHGNKVRR